MPWKETYRLVRQASRVLQAMKKTHQKRKHMEIWKHYETLWIMKLKSQVKKYQKYKSSAPVAPLQVHSWRCEPSPYCARLVPASELLDGSSIGVPPFVQKCPVLRATISQPGKSRAGCRAQHGHVYAHLIKFAHRLRPPTCTHLPQAARPR